MHVGDKCGMVERSGSIGHDVRFWQDYSIVLPVDVPKNTKPKNTQGQENKDEKTSRQFVYNAYDYFSFSIAWQRTSTRAGPAPPGVQGFDLPDVADDRNIVAYGTH
jgi:hypothetical protein